MAEDSQGSACVVCCGSKNVPYICSSTFTSNVTGKSYSVLARA